MEHKSNNKKEKKALASLQRVPSDAVGIKQFLSHRRRSSKVEHHDKQKSAGQLTDGRRIYLGRRRI